MSEKEDRILQNQIEIIWALYYMIGMAHGDLVGRSGALDGMRSDLVYAAKDSRNLLERKTK